MATKIFLLVASWISNKKVNFVPCLKLSTPPEDATKVELPDDFILGKQLAEPTNVEPLSEYIFSGLPFLAINFLRLEMNSLGFQ